MTSDVSTPLRSAYRCPQCRSVVLGDRSRECCGEEMEPIGADAVAEPELPAVLSQVFGISRTGVDICVYLMEDGGATADDIATELEINRSTVTRQLNQLRALGVLERRERALDGGGRVHQYSPVPPEQARQRLREGLISWTLDAATLLGELDRRKLTAASTRDSGE